MAEPTRFDLIINLKSAKARLDVEVDALLS